MDPYPGLSIGVQQTADVRNQIGVIYTKEIADSTMQFYIIRLFHNFLALLKQKDCFLLFVGITTCFIYGLTWYEKD